MLGRERKREEDKAKPQKVLPHTQTERYPVDGRLLEKSITQGLGLTDTKYTTIISAQQQTTQHDNMP